MVSYNLNLFIFLSSPKSDHEQAKDQSKAILTLMRHSSEGRKQPPEKHYQITLQLLHLMKFGTLEGKR